MAEYRWNQSDTTAAYDASAQHVHPHYNEIQDFILNVLPYSADADFMLVDVGGGSGRLAEKFLRAFSHVKAVVVDQSQPFLDLSAKRLEAFPGRGAVLQYRLQDQWSDALPSAPDVIVSMSAIHHLTGPEKLELFRQCHAALKPGGSFLNGDEFRAEDDAEYLNRLTAWGTHMDAVIAKGLVTQPMADALQAWKTRNIGGFGQPRQSGDDCHETTEAQLGYLQQAGFQNPRISWQKDMWAVFQAEKP